MSVNALASSIFFSWSMRLLSKLAFSLAMTVSMAPSAALAADLIGATGRYVTREEDTLLDLARDNDLGYVEIRAANPGIDPWLPGAGKLVTLPAKHVLPDAPRRGIVINLAELRLYYYRPRGEPQTFPIGIGGEGKETP